ncbi:MAG: thioredoxin family protein [Halodesulfurarchaeum sp.]
MVVAESIEELEHGDQAPDFELPGADGERHALADFANYEALVVVFTCNHCPYAQAKFDVLNDIAAAYDDLAVVGINPNDAEEYPEDSLERMVELVADGTIAYDAYLRDESQAVAEAYGAACTPDPFLFERSGDTFVLAYHGRLDDAQSPDAEPSEEPGFEIKAAIESVLAGAPVDVEEVPSRGCSIKWTE